MKSCHNYTIILLCTVLLSAFYVGATSDNTGLRTWTSKKGDAIKATFEKSAYGSVYLKKEDGNTIKIKKTSLSAADQAVVGQLAAATSGSAIEKALASKKTVELPKAPPELYKMFGEKLRTAKNKSVSVDSLTDKVIGVYFSAHWCPPCRAFTPKLVKFYDSLKKEGKPFEIVFVSFDRDKDAMYDYMKEMKMNWLALPYGDKHKEMLAKKFSVSGIPKFVVLNSKGELITDNGRGAVMEGTKTFDAWEKKK